MTEHFNIQTLIGEATAYDKKEMLERKNPRSWLKSVSAFANGGGGALIFGITDDDKIVGLADAKQDSEDISEAVKTHMDPIPTVNLQMVEAEGKTLIVLQVFSGQETPYYFVGSGQRQTYIRIGNESVQADRTQLRQLVLKGVGRTYDSLPAPQKFSDMAFTKLRSVHYQRVHRSFEDSEFASWGIVDEDGRLTNAGALLADESPIRHSRVFCTRWNGLDKASGLGEAIDDVELSGSVIGQLQEAVAFVRNNSHKRWWKENDYREELPDYPERAVTEILVNAIIHRDYMDLGCEVHVDMYDDRLEVFSPGGMVDGSLIQQQDLLTITSRRRNPLLADFFSRLDLMERRGSGMRKILDAYNHFKNLPTYRAPEFHSNARDFRVVLWNLNYDENILKEDGNILKDCTKEGQSIPKEFVKEGQSILKEFVKEGNKFVKGTKEFLKEFTKEENSSLKTDKDCTKEKNTALKNREQFLKERKEFLKAQRQIYRIISKNAKTTAAQMAEEMGISSRQVQKYLKRLTDLKLIAREGGRKMGEWKIIDEDYEKFFERI